MQHSGADAQLLSSRGCSMQHSGAEAQLLSSRGSVSGATVAHSSDTCSTQELST
jgi:hypothetical protein